MKQRIYQAQLYIYQRSVYSKAKSDKHGEVFTPNELIEEMLSKLPSDIWEDKTNTFFDPCAGKGNFPIYIVNKLFDNLQHTIPDEEGRLKHIVEKQIYMAEFQRESAEFINELFKFGNDYKVNLYYGDTLKMPEDFFDLTWEERRIKYSDNCIIQSNIKLENTKPIITPTATSLNIVNPNLTPDEFKRERDLMALFS
jgi:hypothetical protein